MSSVFRPFASGRAIIGKATATGAFTFTDIDGVAVTIASGQRFVLYSAFASGVQTDAATIGFGTTVLAAVTNAMAVPWGVAFPKGTTPTVISLGATATAVVIHGEVLES